MDVWDAEKMASLSRTARRMINTHNHPVSFKVSDIIDLTDEQYDDIRADLRDHMASCAACLLKGYDAVTEDGITSPNYASWARLYVESGTPIPARFAAAFKAELSRTDNPGYVAALQRSINTFGVTVY
jgi:hypothetical protein